MTSTPTRPFEQYLARAPLASGIEMPRQNFMADENLGHAVGAAVAEAATAGLTLDRYCAVMNGLSQHGRLWAGRYAGRVLPLLTAGMIRTPPLDGVDIGCSMARLLSATAKSPNTQTRTGQRLDALMTSMTALDFATGQTIALIENGPGLAMHEDSFIPVHTVLGAYRDLDAPLEVPAQRITEAVQAQRPNARITKLFNLIMRPFLPPATIAPVFPTIPVNLIKARQQLTQSAGFPPSRD